MQFTIPVASGSYIVSLLFAEVYGPTMAQGARVFDVKMENSLVFNDVDIYKDAGNAGNKAVTKSTTISVTDGALNIEFVHTGKQNPKVSLVRVEGSLGERSVCLPFRTTQVCGISVVPAGGPSPGPSPSGTSIYLNAGGNTYTDTSGRTWVADGPFVNTGTAYQSFATISGTPDQTIYKSERYDVPSGPEMKYSITVPNGQYVVALHFAETYGPTQGVDKRVFDVKMEEAIVFNDVDIYKESGNQGDKAYVKSTSVNVGDGVLNIEFIHIPGKENPKASHCDTTLTMF